MPAEVQAAFDAATAYFNGGAGTRSQVIGWAGILGSYNEGDYSQHCDQ
jgi:hypothetical protein